MYPTVLTNHPITSKQVINKYQCKLNDMANSVLNNYKFGTSLKVDKLAYLKIKNLLSLASIHSNTTYALNHLYKLV